MKEKTLKYYAQEAMDIQNASNICGVSIAFHNCVCFLRKELSGNDEVNNHAITKMYVSKIKSLTNCLDDCFLDFSNAYGECERIINK